MPLSGVVLGKLAVKDESFTKPKQRAMDQLMTNSKAPWTMPERRRCKWTAQFPRHRGKGMPLMGASLRREGLKDHSTQKGFQRSLVTKIQRQSVQHGEQCLDGKMLSCLCVTLPGNTTLLLQAFNISLLHVSNVNPMNGWVCHLTIATYVKYFQFSENFEFHGVSCLKKIILFWLYHDAVWFLCHPQTESEFKEHKFKITTLCFFAWQLWSAKVPWVSGISKFTWGLDLGNPKKLGAKIDLFFTT